MVLLETGIYDIYVACSWIGKNPNLENSIVWLAYYDLSIFDEIFFVLKDLSHRVICLSI